MEAIYAAPAFIVNMDRCATRFESSKKRISEAGFLDVRRWRAVDAKDSMQLATAWKIRMRYVHNVDFDKKDPDFVKFPGKQGVYLSMLSLWKHIVDEKIPVASIFEDDIKFHEQWHDLGPEYMKHTPSDYDVIFMGNQLDSVPPPFHICKVPVYCLHAYIITLEGARKLLEEFSKIAPRTIDCILLEMMQIKHKNYQVPFNHYVWNGTHFPSQDLQTSVIRRRNTGLVFQDDDFDSDIQPFK
jgi:GR25 family glycosyltransferase involved in LPS biosynthesis